MRVLLSCKYIFGNGCISEGVFGGECLPPGGRWMPKADGRSLRPRKITETVRSRILLHPTASGASSRRRPTRVVINFRPSHRRRECEQFFVGRGLVSRRISAEFSQTEIVCMGGRSKPLPYRVVINFRPSHRRRGCEKFPPSP